MPSSIFEQKIERTNCDSPTFSAYAKKIGFTGQFLVEPKPKEPTKHQYDFGEREVLPEFTCVHENSEEDNFSLCCD